MPKLSAAGWNNDPRSIAEQNSITTGPQSRTTDFGRKLCDERSPVVQQDDATVVVITHDGHYLGDLDGSARGLRMDEGRLVGRHSMENG